MKKALRYLRFSDDNQSQHSIERQDIITRQWAEYNQVEVVDTFTDEGHSARNFDRPDIKHLFTFLKNNRGIDFLIVAELTRFSRDAADAIKTVQGIQADHGVRIVSASRGSIYDVMDHNSFFMMGLEFLLGNTENIKRMNDVNGGIYTAKAVKGKWIHGAPYGYRVDGKGDKRTLVMVPEEAIIVRYIYDSYLEGMSITELQKKIKTMGFNRTGNSAILDILRQPLYYGYQHVKAWKHLPGGLLPVTNAEPVIEENLWKQVDAKLNGKKKHRIVFSDRFPLRGAVKCGVCGAPLTGAPSRSTNGRYYDYYNCQKGGHVNINTTKAHQQLKEIFAALSWPAGLIEDVMAEAEGIMAKSLAERGILVKTAEAELASVNKQLQSLEEKYIRDEINSERFHRWSSSLQAQRHSLLQRTGELKETNDNYHELLKLNAENLAHLDRFFEMLLPHRKNEFIREVFDNTLSYVKGSYRTANLIPELAHNKLILKQKNLMIFDESSQKPELWR